MHKTSSYFFQTMSILQSVSPIAAAVVFGYLVQEVVLLNNFGAYHWLEKSILSPYTLISPEKQN